MFIIPNVIWVFLISFSLVLAYFPASFLSSKPVNRETLKCLHFLFVYYPEYHSELIIFPSLSSTPSSKLSACAPQSPILSVGTTCRPQNSSTPWVPKSKLRLCLFAKNGVSKVNQDLSVCFGEKGERRHKSPITLWVPKSKPRFHLFTFGKAEVRVAFNDRAERYHSRNLVTERVPSSKQKFAHSQK